MKRLVGAPPTILSQVAMKCGDNAFRDFDKKEYTLQVLYAMREVAQKYEVLNRIAAFDLENQKDAYPIKIESFSSEYLVRINGQKYEQGNKRDIKQYEYYLYHDQNKYLFNFTPKADKNRVEIYYTADISIDDFKLEDTTPLLEGRFDEEVIHIATTHVAELGIAKFEHAKREKYQHIYNIYSKRTKGIDTRLAPNKPWIKIGGIDIIGN